MKEGEQRKVGIIINSASYDRVAYSLSVASMYSLNGNEVHVMFTYGAIIRLVKGNADNVGEETETWIRETVIAASKNKSIPRISETLKWLHDFGGKIYACVAAMATHNLVKDDLTEEVEEVTSISGFLEKIEDASIVIYV